MAGCAQQSPRAPVQAQAAGPHGPQGTQQGSSTSRRRCVRRVPAPAGSRADARPPVPNTAGVAAITLAEALQYEAPIEPDQDYRADLEGRRQGVAAEATGPRHRSAVSRPIHRQAPLPANRGCGWPRRGLSERASMSPAPGRGSATGAGAGIEQHAGDHQIDGRPARSKCRRPAPRGHQGTPAIDTAGFEAAPTAA